MPLSDDEPGTRKQDPLARLEACRPCSPRGCGSFLVGRWRGPCQGWREWIGQRVRSSEEPLTGPESFQAAQPNLKVTPFEDPGRSGASPTFNTPKREGLKPKTAEEPSNLRLRQLPVPGLGYLRLPQSVPEG